jgi:hypothetical protein
MKRPQRQPDGLYHIRNKTYKQLFGSREQVFNGTAYKTEGLLTKDDIVQNKWGRLVSRKKYVASRRFNNLAHHGYFARKGRFGYTRRRKSQVKRFSYA